MAYFEEPRCLYRVIDSVDSESDEKMARKKLFEEVVFRASSDACTSYANEAIFGKSKV